MAVIVAFLMLVTWSYGITLEEAMKLALQRNPELKALEKDLDSFRGKEIAAYAFPNPEADVESGFVTTERYGRPEGRPIYLFGVSQPIPLWGVREKSRLVVREEREAFKNFLEARRREVLAEVYRLFYEALFRKEIVNIWRENLKTAKEVEEFVRRAYQLGEVTQLDLLRAKRERDLAEVRLKIAEAEFRASLRDLERVINAEVEDVEGNLREIRDIRDIELEDLPTVRAIKRRIRAVERGVDLEKALAKPTLSAGFIVEDSEEGYYGLRLSLSVGIPVFYRRQGEILEKIYQKEALKRRLEGEILRVRKRLRSIKIRLSALKRELERIENVVIPRAKEELDLAIRSYRLRVITLLELSDVRRRYYELLVSRARILRDIHFAFAEFISIGGVER